LDTIPYTVQRLTSLNDITRRIELEADDIPEDNTPAPIRPMYPNKKLEKALYVQLIHYILQLVAIVFSYALAIFIFTFYNLIYEK
jgi:Ca2+-dependent lipid-binding protein